MKLPTTSITYPRRIFFSTKQNNNMEMAALDAL